MKKLLILSVFLLPLIGCKEESTNAAMPEVNNANCAIEKIKAMPDTPMREKFAGECLSRDSVQKVPAMDWSNELRKP